MKSRFPALVCVLALAVSPALADDAANPPAAPPSASAAAPGGLSRVLGAIFGGKTPKSLDTASFDTTDASTAVPPPPLPPPSAPPVAATTKPRVIVRLVVMPMPRLRPTRPDTNIPPGVSDETTASIPEMPPEPPAAVRSIEPPPVATAASPPAADPPSATPPSAAASPTIAAPSVVVMQPKPATLPPVQVEEEPRDDGLLGDVTTFRAPQSTAMNPNVPAPAVVDPDKPPSAEQVAPPLPPDVVLPPDAAPYQLVRTLQSVQDRIAQGVPAAVVAQRALLAEIDRQFAAAPAATWQDRRNAEAAVTYVLSGGAPGILKRLSTMDPKPVVDMRLVNGVLAYALGREPEAWAALGELDPLTLPASMAAQVAMAQSALAVRTDPQKSMRLLSLARLLAPGTLVEEAAIRRQLFVATQLKDNVMVESLARQYLDRFRHSVYAGNFRQRFAAAISQMDIDSEAKFAHVDDMLSGVEARARCQLYLTVASASIVKGQFTAGRLAAERAATFSSPGSAEEAQARLYGAAALAADPKGFDTAVTDFNGVNRALLRASDQALYEMVAMTLEGIRSGTERDQMPSTAELPPPDKDPSATEIAKRATEAVQSADALLKVAAR